MHRELRLAHLALGVMTMGYIWQEGEENIAKVPRSFILTLNIKTFILFCQNNCVQSVGNHVKVVVGMFLLSFNTYETINQTMH